MSVVIGLLSSICLVISAPVYNDADNTYILATVLFYKDDKGQIMIASGPVPQLTDIAVRDDIMSRIDGAAVKVVPIFNDGSAIPRSLDVLDFVKDEYENIFVTEIPKRLSRNIIKDIWSYNWRGIFSKNKSKRKLTNAANENGTPGRMINRVKQPVGERILVTVYHKDFTEPTGKTTVEAGTGKVVEDITDAPVTVTDTTINIVNENEYETQDEDSNKAKVLKNADDFIPNDIYYGIEKKCVNWSNGCNLQSKNFFNLTGNHFKYAYTRPRIVQWGP